MADITRPLNWCAIYIDAGSEQNAYTDVIRRGLRAYAPSYVKRVPNNTSSSGARNQRCALFPRYLFAGWTEPGEWKEVARLTWVRSHILMSNDHPSIIPDAFIRELAGHEEQLANQLKLGKRMWNFKVGEQVRVTDGPFSGFYAKLIKLDDDGRIGLLLDLFGRQVPITSGMTADQIEAAF